MQGCRDDWKRFRRGSTLVAAALVATSCSGGDDSGATSTAATTTTTTRVTTTTAATTTTPTAPAGPAILAVTASAESVPAYGRLDLTVEIDAEYANPFDQREVTLDAVFNDPAGETWNVPGFWNGRDAWAIRFTPSTPGTWQYGVSVTDARGTSFWTAGTFDVTPSDHNGFLRVGSWVDPDYSARYLAYEDGTPWFGFGHADLGMSWDGFDGDTFRKMADMVEIGENLEMWWPLWAMNYLQNDYATYNPTALDTIDLVLAEAEQNGIGIAFTIWNHQLLRTNEHAWGNGLWNSNGFRNLVDGPQDFFVDEEAWAWQENMYRYIVARWAHSPAVAMWQTVSEINGTESYDQTDPWHDRLNAWFQEHDPYRHPTTASMSGGQFWPRANEVVDVPQMHVYEQFDVNPIAAAKIMADWTVLMWEDQEKPNWIGEYGVRLQRAYPEFMHNSNWATLAAGAATTPIEWNDRQTYGQFDADQRADMKRFVDFVNTVPLVQIDPDQLAVTTSHPEVRAWGLGGPAGGVVWAQDFAGESPQLGVQEDLDAMRARRPREGIVLHLDGMPAGSFVANPYDTWTGEWLDPIEIACDGTNPCELPLPTFTFDVALRLDPA